MHTAGHLVLDLDGTISDPAVGILRSLNFALAHFGYPTIADGEVGRYIGPPIDASIRSIIGPSPPGRVEQLVTKYRERYAEIGYSENVLYDGVPEALEKLASAGTSLGVCTSKRIDFAERILGLFKLRQYFDFVSGGDIGVHKKQQLAALLDAGDISPGSMMVGDRAVDIAAAKENRMRSAGVLWGHGSVAELSSAGPDHLLEQPHQLVELAHAVQQVGSIGLMFRVRPFEERDTSALSAIYRECRAEATWLPRPAKAPDFAQDTKGEVLLVAVGSDDEPEGFVSVWEPDAFIHHLYVRPGSRQKGIGKQLLESLRSRMRKPWRLKCVRANDRALRFYLRHGWLEISSGIGEDGPYAVLEKS